MTQMYAQRIYDLGLSAYVYYSDLEPNASPNPADTNPVGTGSYDPTTHEVLTVYTDPTTDYLGGVPVELPSTPVLGDSPVFDGVKYAPSAGGGGGAALVEWNGTDFTQFTSGSTPSFTRGTFGTFAENISTATYPYGLVVGDEFTIQTDLYGLANVVFSGTDTSMQDVINEINAVTAQISARETLGGDLSVFSLTCGNPSTMTLADVVPGTLAKLGLVAGSYTGATTAPTATVATMPGTVRQAIRIQADGMGPLAGVGYTFTTTSTNRNLRATGQFISGYSAPGIGCGIIFGADPTKGTFCFAGCVVMSTTASASYVARSDLPLPIVNTTYTISGYYFSVNADIDGLTSFPYPSFFTRVFSSMWAPVIPYPTIGTYVYSDDGTNPYTGDWTTLPAPTNDHLGFFIGNGPGPILDPVDIYVPFISFTEV